MNQQSTFTRCILTMILAVSVGLPACTTVETQSFRASQSGNFEAAHIATDADFGKYESLYIKEMGIFFPQNSASTDKDMRRIREIFRGAFIAALQGYKIVQQAGPSTMTVQASLIDLRDASGNQISGIRKELRDMAAPARSYS